MSNNMMIDTAKIVKDVRANNIRSAMGIFGYCLMQAIPVTSVTGDYDIGYKVNGQTPQEWADKLKEKA